LRFLYVVNYYKPAYAYGGPVQAAAGMCEALAAAGAQVTVLTTNANAGRPLDVPPGRAVDQRGVEVWYFPVAGRLPASFFYSPALAEACAARAGEHDIAFLDTFYTHAMGPAAAACRRASVPYIVSLRGQLLPWALRRRGWKKQAYLSLAGKRYLNEAAALHCTDEVEAEAARALGLGAPAFVVPNAVEAERFGRLPERGALRRRLGIPAEAFVLLFLGRLHPVKRPDVAVQVLASLQNLERPVHLLMAGPDEAGLGGALDRQAAELNCSHGLHRLGLLEGAEVSQALADADLLVMPSESESFGNAAAEALAAGLPVLVSDRVPVGRQAEAAGAGRTSALTAEAFSAAARQMLEQGSELRQMGERGRRLAGRAYDRPAVAQQMLSQCRAIIETGRPLSEYGPALRPLVTEP
jgi:glycosyltransferase involved in cell wall biosynthesis